MPVLMCGVNVVFKTNVFNQDTFGQLGFPCKKKHFIFSKYSYLKRHWSEVFNVGVLKQYIVNTFLRANIFNVAIIWADGFPM